MRDERDGSNETKAPRPEERPDAREASSPKDNGSRTARSNRRVAWTLFALSAVFFGGIIFSRVTGDSRTGLMVLGAAIFLFLVVAIGRNLRK